ncbi:MAG: bifunctional cobalt-precorrin-7 (C(5))-methyltransferase/cobalt-precorrin-6B (C(15))-methyltransferase, partial [Lachnospiraceae bacterium]|nr:bifunctional cobalt-precorrin-7 (C(5))-methyltransferase/cobalt-precorrin-6B (C(15))-methyltransferase [Lachnospiraceae bacterium]
THVFIGGSGGNLKEILAAIFAKNPKTSIVANAVSHETFEEFLQIEKNFNVSDFDIVQMAVTRTRKVGNYHMLQAENPVWICSFKGNLK